MTTARARKMTFPRYASYPWRRALPFAGDAENARLAELLDEGDLDSDVLKVPHHGRYERLSAAFFAAVSPQYAVVASSQDDLEDAETVYALQAAGAQVLLTRNGAVEIVSDGQSVSIAQ